MISIEREKLLSEFEQQIGYSFRSRALLDRALTHRSFAHERAEQNCQHNESLEFLGDSVLGLVVSAWLLKRFPTLSEGKLSKMKAFLVSEPSLVELAETLNLGTYILLNRGEEKTGGRRKGTLLADAYEALIGALFLDGGIQVAERFLLRELQDKVFSIDPNSMIGSDYKSVLQEQLQALGAPAPKYVVVETLGPDHRRTFRIELRVGGQTLAMGEGRSIKIAQQEAAQAALATPAAFDKVKTLLAGPMPPANGNAHKVEPRELETDLTEDEIDSVFSFVALADELALLPLHHEDTAAFEQVDYDQQRPSSAEGDKDGPVASINDDLIG